MAVDIFEFSLPSFVFFYQMSSLSCIVATLEKEEEEEKLNYTRAAPVDLGSIGNLPIIRTKWKDDTTVGYKLVAKEWMIYSDVYRHVFHFCTCICGGGGCIGLDNGKQ